MQLAKFASELSIILATISIARTDGSLRDRLQRWRKTKRYSPACPVTPYGSRGSVCPLAAAIGNTVCIEDRQLCDGAWDCPDHEDEHPIMCLFYRAIKHEMYHVLESTRPKSGRSIALHELFSRLSTIQDLIGAFHRLETETSPLPHLSLDRVGRLAQSRLDTKNMTIAQTGY